MSKPGAAKPEMMVGAPTGEQTADSEIQEMVEKIRAEVESRLAADGGAFDEFTAVKYRSQLVNGINFFVRIHTGSNRFVHVRLHRTFQGEVSFVHAKTADANAETIEYF